MADTVTATTPDGREVTLSAKAFDLIYRQRGYTETGRETAPETAPVNTGSGPVKAARAGRRKRSLPPDASINTKDVNDDDKARDR